MESDSELVVVVLPTSIFEGCALPPDKPMREIFVDLLEIEFSEIVLSLYSYPVLVQVGWMDPGKVTTREIRKMKSVLLDKSFELYLQLDFLLDMTERIKRKEDIILRHVTGRETNFLNVNFNLMHYDFDELKDSLSIALLATYKRELEQHPIDKVEYKGNMFFRSGLAGKKKCYHTIKYQTVLVLSKIGVETKIVEVIVLDAYDFRVEKLEDGTDGFVLERLFSEDKRVLVLQPEDKTKWGLWQDLIRSQTHNTANKMVFGVSLSTLMSHPNNLRRKVPEILSSTLSFLDNEEFLNEEGLWRKTGNLAQIERCIKKFDLGEVTNLQSSTDEEYVECHTATGLIKKWLGRLPEPLLVPYQAFVNCFSDDSKQMTADVMRLVSQLPLHNIYVLLELCYFLFRVSLKQESNKMSINNLALVIGPNVLWTHENENSPSQLADSLKISTIFGLLIEHHQELIDLSTKLDQEEKSDSQKMFEKRQSIQRIYKTKKEKRNSRPELGDTLFVDDTTSSQKWSLNKHRSWSTPRKEAKPEPEGIVVNEFLYR
eukprot:TRINITY_DN15479_c0_g1_i4.p1 TRINITY_DN15479_c0_g1~~TRINITY_DN15479_c0_g1_i4.p1  ORF type:complete len:598 (+),score=137.54 TRINITY_DN15479_c0_g1_i4:166-1794(+)